VNVTETFRAARNESERLGAPGQDEVLVAVNVTASRGDGPNRTRTFVLPIVDQAQTYTVQGEDGTIRFNNTQTVSVPATPGPLQAYGGPILLIAGLVAGGVLVAARRLAVLEFSEAERERLAYRNHRNEFADWITTGRLPSRVFDEPRTEVDSLAGLVDVAIDTDERVIHDVDRGTYNVVGDGLRYVYEPPAVVRDDAAGDDVLADDDTEIAATTDEPRTESEVSDDASSFDEDDADDAFDELDDDETGEDSVDDAFDELDDDEIGEDGVDDEVDEAGATASDGDGLSDAAVFGDDDDAADDPE
jgi:hypothetical protein